MKKKNNIFGAILLVGVLAIVPLIVSAHLYQTELSSFSWFSGKATSYDFFLYWKGQALILLCGILALYTAVKMFAGRNDVLAPTERKFLIPLFAYFVLVVLSTVLSSQRDVAIWGDYEQWEGAFVLGCYVIVLFMAYGLLQGEKEIAIIRGGLLGGVLVLSFLSAMQYFGNDFFRSPAGQWVMNFASEKKLRFQFNFDVGRVYSTLHNPNYVGSYVALLLPIILSMISLKGGAKSYVKSFVAALSAGFLAIMLVGSQSVTGFIGLVSCVIPIGILLIKKIRRKPIKSAVVVLGCVVLAAVAVCLNRPIFEYGLNKIMNPTPNQFVIEEMVSRQGKLEIRTVEDNVLQLTATEADTGLTLEATDEKGKKLTLNWEESSSRYKFDDTRFQEIELRNTTVNANGKEQDAFVVETPSVGKAYTVLVQTHEYANGLLLDIYQMYNPFNRVDAIKEIPRMGFRDNQHFGSRRGYIWSRTFPLLKRHIVLGSGPNTFVYEFPNNDYVGMKNVGYDGAIVTKPHNMFLQIFVQTGLLSLIAFLVLYGLYFVQCMRCYCRKTQYCWYERFGVGICVGTFGYLVTGLANDSTVAVAPLYWCLLGVGLAINRLVIGSKEGIRQSELKGETNENQ